LGRAGRLVAGETAAGTGPAEGRPFVVARGTAFAEVISHDQSPRL
jgi:hypothetical protein